MVVLDDFGFGVGGCSAESAVVEPCEDVVPLCEADVRRMLLEAARLGRLKRMGFRR